MVECNNILTHFLELVKTEIQDYNRTHDIAYRLAQNMIHTLRLIRSDNYSLNKFHFINTTSLMDSHTKTCNHIEALHYYLELLREKNAFETGKALHNIIRTMRVSRQNMICGENFGNLDFENIPLNGIQWSINGKNATCFDRSVINVSSFLGGHTGGISSLIWTYDGRKLLTGGEDGKIILWDTESGQIIKSFIGHTNKITEINIDNNSKTFISSAYDCTVRVWSIETGECKHCLEHSSAVLTTTIINSNQCLTGSKDMTIKLWNFNTEECIATFEGKTNSVKSLCVLPDKQHCLIASWNRPVKCLGISDYSFGSLLPVFATTVHVCRDGSRCITDSYVDRSAKVWELDKGVCINVLKDRDKLITAVDISASGERCITGTEDGRFIIWDALTGTICKRLTAHTDVITTVKFDSSGNRCATASKDGIIKIWSVLTGKCIQTIQTYTNKITALTISRDCQSIYTGQNCGVIKQWDVSMPTFLFKRSFNTNCKEIDHLTLSPNQKLLLLKRKGENIVSMDLRNSNETELAGTRCQEQYFANFVDDTLCLTGHYRSTIALLDTVTKSIIKEYKGHNRMVSSIAVSHDCDIFITGSYDASAKLWNIGTGKCICKLEGHKKIINTVAISNNKKYALTGSNDKTIKLWDIKNNSCIHTFKEHFSKIKYVSFMVDDKSFISYSEDGIIKLWEINSKQCVDTYQLSLTESDMVSCFFPFFTVHNNGICSIYKIDCNVETCKLETSSIGTIYNVKDLQITNCSFKDIVADETTREILFQYGAELQ